MESILHERDRTNDLTSGMLHLIGIGLAVAVLVVLIVVGAQKGGPLATVGYSLYGAGLILLYLASSAYHLIPRRFPRAKDIARRFDHAMIYVLIAATYTPITFIVLSGGWRWSIFGTIWGLAVLGAAAKLLKLPLPPFASAFLYIIMGWMAAVAFSPLLQNISATELWLLVSGGLSYTLGVVFFALERILPQKKYFWMHEIFHVFVLGGSALHTIVMFLIA